jgi:hypothetical protein
MPSPAAAAAFLKPAAFQAALVPYRRVLAILLRDSCVSIAVSNPHMTLAEGAGAVLLRPGGKLPRHAFGRLIGPDKLGGTVAGVVIGHERGFALDALGAEPAAAAGELLAEAHEVLAAAHGAGALFTWWGDWTPDSPASCRLPPPEPLAEGAKPPVCSMAATYLQSYLDQLGADNTFG